jgi:two-component system response regulator
MSYRKALLVDDDPVFRALAEDLVLDAGVGEVAMAEDGGQAIAALDGGYDPDLLICDLNMPALDGVSLIRQLAERRFAGKVIVV